MSISPDQVIKDINSGFLDKLDHFGLTEEFEIKQLKQEFKADAPPKIQKLKGAVDPDSLPKGWKLVTTTGLVEWRKSEDGPKRVFTDGESLVSLPMKDMGIRQKARQDLGKMRGHFVERHEHMGKVVNVLEFTQEQLKQFMPLVKARGDKLEKEHLDAIGREPLPK